MEEEGYYIVQEDWDDTDYWTTINTKIVDAGLSPAALALYINLKRNWREYKWSTKRIGEQLVNNKPKGCIRSDKELAEDCNTSIPQIIKARDELLQCGLVVIKDGVMKLRWGDE